MSMVTVLRFLTRMVTLSKLQVLMLEVLRFSMLVVIVSMPLHTCCRRVCSMVMPTVVCMILVVVALSIETQPLMRYRWNAKGTRNKVR